MVHARVVTLILILLACVPAAATVVISMDLPELVTAARTIAYGRVVDTRATVTGGRTETVVTLATLSYLKGEGGREVEFRVPGGQIGRYRTIVVGAPVLGEGDEVVVFLGGEGAELPVVVGFSQGVLRVQRSSPDADPVILAPPSPRGDDQPQRVVRGEPSRRVLSLPVFLDEVRALAAGAGDLPKSRERTVSGTGKNGGR